MTPLEINKKIAELKCIKNYEMDCKIQGMPVFSGFPNWAENISDAWELFEECEEIFIKKMKFVDGQQVYECLIRDSSLNVLGRSRTNNATIAICLAWLAWKE